MPQIIIHLTDDEFQKVIETVRYNGTTDLEEETFSGTEIIVGMCPIGHSLTVKGYRKCEIDNVGIEFKEE